MSIKAIKQSRVSDEVFEQIKDHIISSEWSPGTKIPGELELADMFAVSRVSVREAIHRLVGMGVLTIRRGEGTFVNEILPKDYFNSLLSVLMIDGPSLLEMLEFRAIMEIESAKFAALRANDDDITRMYSIIGSMKKCEGNKVIFAKEDLNFHMALALATHNSVLVKVNAILHDMLKKAMEEIVDLTGYKGGIYYHNKILNAIIERDGEAASELMREHINVTVARVKELTENQTDSP